MSPAKISPTSQADRTQKPPERLEKLIRLSRVTHSVQRRSWRCERHEAHLVGCVSDTDWWKTRWPHSLSLEVIFICRNDERVDKNVSTLRNKHG